MAKQDLDFILSFFSILREEAEPRLIPYVNFGVSSLYRTGDQELCNILDRTMKRIKEQREALKKENDHGQGT